MVNEMPKGLQTLDVFLKLSGLHDERVCIMFSSSLNKRLTPQTILTMVVDRLRRELPDHALQTQRDDPFRLQLCHPEAGELVLNLGNLVHEIHGSPPDTAEEMISAYVSMAKQAFRPPEVMLDSVFPTLRHHEFLSAVEYREADPLIGEGPGDLVSVVIADLGAGLATLTQDIAAEAGHTPEDILQAAERNFVGLLPHEIYTIERSDGVVSIGLDGYPWLGASLLFVPSIIGQVMTHFGWSRAMVTAPTRETVDIVDAESSDAKTRVEQWMQRQLSQPRSQSEFVLSMGAGDEYLRTTHRLSNGRLLGLN